MRGRGELEFDPVSRSNLSTVHHDPHDAGLANQVAARVVIEGGFHEAGLKLVELVARVAQAGDLYDGRAPNVQTRTRGEREQAQSDRGDVLTHAAWVDGEPTFAKLVVQLRVNEVDLAQIRLRRVAGDSRPVFHRRSLVGVVAHTQACDEQDRVAARFAQGVDGTPTHRGDEASERFCARRRTRETRRGRHPEALLGVFSDLPATE